MLEKPILILTTTMLLCGCAGMSATHPKCTSDPSKAEHHFVTNVSLEDAIETAKKLEIGKVISAELEHELGRAPVYEIEIVSDWTAFEKLAHVLREDRL